MDKVKYEVANIPLADMRVNAVAQRDYKPTWSEKLADEFDLNMMGMPVLNKRDGVYHIIDGRHRVQAARIFGFSEDTPFPCIVYTGLSDREEAQMFLRLNFRRNVVPYDMHKVSCTAGVPEALQIETVVQKVGLIIVSARNREARHGNVGCVGTLYKIFRRSGANILFDALRISYEAFGDEGADGPILDGLALFLEKYDEADRDLLTEKLNTVRGGVQGIYQPAQKYVFQTGSPRNQCVAAAIADAYNRAMPKGKKLSPWWK